MKDKEQNLTADELKLRIDSSIESVVKPNLFSGVIALAIDYNVVYHSIHGYANRSLQTQPDLDTKFNLGSLNKMITSLAIAILVQAEKLSYNDSVAAVLPSSKIDRSDKIKVHHLLTHTSGLGHF